MELSSCTITLIYVELSWSNPHQTIREKPKQKFNELLYSEAAKNMAM
jgi:hypothetical protein